MTSSTLINEWNRLLEARDPRTRFERKEDALAEASARESANLFTRQAAAREEEERQKTLEIARQREDAQLQANATLGVFETSATAELERTATLDALAAEVDATDSEGRLL